MTRFSRALPIALLLILAACTPTADTTPSAEPTATPEPSPSATAEPTETPDATESPEASDPASSPIEGVGGFTWLANLAADALMDETFDCQNLDDGYQIDFPAEWNANAELGNVPPCSWFAATEYETGAPGEVPDEVVIVIQRLDRGDYEYGGSEILEREEGLVGATQAAERVIWMHDGETIYHYVVQLGPPGEGPLLVVGTSDGQDGDFELNKAVLDRMVATMEFIGIIQ
jgi:hypothetical protein